jgi:hypothetical protein
MNTTLLGRFPELDEVDDHQPVEHGTLTRCELDGQLWPCSTVETARLVTTIPVDLLEMIEVGWFLAARYPEQMDPPPRRVRGIVAGYRDDPERGRIFTLVGASGGRPRIRELAARDVDPSMGDEARPNSMFIHNAYRSLAAHVGKQTGSADGTEVKYLAMALALAQAST